MIFTAIGGLIAGALFGGSVLAATLISGALAFGAKYLLNAYLNRQKRRSYSAVQGESQIGGAVPVSTLYGKGKTRGHRLGYFKWGEGNKFNAEVFRLAHGWCDGLEPYIYFYGKKYELYARAKIGNEVAHYGVTGFGDLISIRFYDGRPGQQADMNLVNATAGLGQKWKATSVCANMAYVVVQRTWDSDNFKRGRPQFEFAFRGLREYDPRKDSTVAGGSGAQRLDDPSTWVWGENPAVHRLNYQLGLRGLISDRTLIGEGKSMGQLDLSSYFAAMNVCDTVRTTGKKTYACSLFVNSNDDHTEILKEMDDAMAGYAMNRRGLSGVIPGAPQVPVLDLTGDDIDMGRAKQLQFRKSGFDLYNQMSGQFTSIEKNWEAESLKPIVVNADVAADGRARATANDFLQVTDADIAQYLLTIRYRQNRHGGTATVPVSRRAGLAIVEGEWITYRGRTWLVTKWASDSNFRITLSLSETSADIYDGGTIQPGPIIVPSPDPINPSELTNVQNFAVTVGSIAGANGDQVPVLRFTWEPPADPTITTVVFYYCIGNDPTGQTIFQDQTADVEGGEYVTSKDIRGGVFYSARATIITVPDRFKAFSPWVTTILQTPLLEVYPPGLIKEINDRTDASLYFVGEGTRALRDRLIHNTLATIDQDGRNVLDKQEIRISIRASVAALDAKYESVVTTLVSDTTALSQRVETTEAALNGYSGAGAVANGFDAMSSMVTTIDGKVTAQSDALTHLTGVVGDSSSEALLRISTAATEAGATSTIALSVAATSGAGTSAAAILLSAIAGDKSMIGLVADLTYFSDGAGNKLYPVVVENGQMRANFLNIGTFRAGAGISDDGLMVVDWNNKRIVFSE